ncbi:MAG: hypothetical protein NT175_08885 [Bacteroidetes bacterium]|nr:hypothetical protein [Bacteroidota bacterium]
MFISLHSYPLIAQFYNGSQLTFGKNRVQYNDFLWTYYQFENIDTYFYLNGNELAIYAAKYAQAHLEAIKSQLDTDLEDKIQFIIYNSLPDLKQSNIGLLGEQHYNTGGITHIIGHKVFLYFDGDLTHFQNQIRAGIVKVLIDQTLYGGSVGTQIKNTTLMALPTWYVDGLVSFISEEWNSEIDNYVKDGILSGRYKKFNQLTGIDALYAGHAIWNYIAEKYGKNVVSNVVYMAKISRNVENGFLYVLGISFKNLMKECYEYYLKKYSEANSGMTEPGGMKIIRRPKNDVVYGALKLSPDGRYAAYTRNDYGKCKVYVYELSSRKKDKILRTGFRLDEKTDYTYPILTWHPSGKLLAIITEFKGHIILYYYNIDTGKKIRQTLFNFEKIVDFSYSPDGKSFLFSAVQKGQSDLFIYDIASNTYEEITKDIFNDLNPCFINNGSQILFSSNRTSDTLRYTSDINIDASQETNDLFLYDLTSRSNVLRRIALTPTANEIQPEELGKGQFTYLSDYNGVYNRYIARFDSSITFIDTTTHYRYFTESFPVTNYSRNILIHSVQPSANLYGEVVYKDKKFTMYIDSLSATEALIPVELMSTPYAEKMRQQFDQEQQTLKEENKKTQQPDRKRFSNVHTLDQVDEKAKIDIHNYLFDKQSFIKVSGKDTLDVVVPLPSVSEKTSAGFIIPKKRNYDVEFSINELISQIDFTYLNYSYQAFSGGGEPIFQTPGFNAFFNVGVTDLLEDYRISGGVRLSVDLSNNEYLLSFANLRKRLDKEIIFHRKAFEEVGTYSLIKHYSHELYYVLKYPFSPVMSIRGTLTLRNDRAVYLSTDQINLKEPDQSMNWAVLKGEFIYDDTRELGLNLYHGTRFKIFGEYYNQIAEKSSNLIIVGLDIRNYIKIHRTLIWANRFAASTSLGTNKLIYYLGGVDNWISPSFNRETPIDYDQNYIYQTLATNMRGFTQNIRNGNSFALINSELRFPVIRYFANRPLKSDFLNNLQIVGFGDIGTAWTGLNPYSKENSLFTRVIEQPPMLITVEVQKDPIVEGFGFGLRSRVFGYFLRADLSWGVEDGIILPSQFYFSLSLDF